MTEENTPHPVDLHVGRRLRLARQDKGFSQEALAVQCGVTFQQMQKYEKGANRVSASRLWQMARAMRVPLPWFFEGLPEDLQAEAPEARAIRSFIDTKAGRELIAAAQILPPSVLEAHVKLMQTQAESAISAAA